MEVGELSNARAYIYKNGNSLYMFQGVKNEQGNDAFAVTGTLSLDLAVADYIEVYGRNDNDAGTPYFLGNLEILLMKKGHGLGDIR